MISIEAYRAAIGRYYSKARSLSNNCSQQFNYCGCKKYEKDIYKLSHYTDSVMHKYFNSSSVHKEKEFTEKDLEFCIVTIEHMFDVSFLKILQLVIDGIESNPGPTENIECTPTRGNCLLYTSPSPRDRTRSRMPSSA